ncbi:MAG: VanW family protein [Armatimonadetes bacterium]|nr:VanW family protein [Armatimonadota bacterium]
MKAFVPLGATALLAGGVVFGLVATPPPEVVLSAYATPLEGRVKGQRLNAGLALSKLDGVVIAPGEEFSFNKVVGTWSRDEGYRRAPVSFNGQLVWTWGGGVCQTSSTLYNTALLAGMEITERHRHRFAPGYIPPGRDAAVAYSNIDLRFRNPRPWPVRIVARVQDKRVVCEILGKSHLKDAVAIIQIVDSVREPQTLSDARGASGNIANPGKHGYSVSTLRVFRGPTGERRELLSKDSYPAMNRIIQRGD